VELWEENEQKKEYLKSYGRAKRREKRIMDEIQRLRMDKMFPSVINDDMPHGTNVSDLSDYIVRVETEIEKLKRERLEKIKLYSEIEGRINTMQDDDEKEILRLKYMVGLSWEEVAVSMGFTYRHTTRKHGQALKNFKMS